MVAELPHSTSLQACNRRAAAALRRRQPETFARVMPLKKHMRALRHGTKWAAGPLNGRIAVAGRLHYGRLPGFDTDRQMTIPTARVSEVSPPALDAIDSSQAPSASVSHAERPVLTEKENYQRLIGYLRKEDEVLRRLEEAGHCTAQEPIEHFQLLNGDSYRVPAAHVTREHLRQYGIYFQVVPHDHLKDCWIVDGLPTVDLSTDGTRLLPTSCRIAFDDGSAGFDVRVPLFPAPAIYSHAPNVDGRMLIALALTTKQDDTRWADSQLHSDDYLISYRVRPLIPAEERIADLLVTLRVNANNQLLECIVVDRPTSVRKASARFTPSAMAASMLAAAAIASQSSGASFAQALPAQSPDLAQKLIDKGLLKPASVDMSGAAMGTRPPSEPRHKDDMRPQAVRAEAAGPRVVQCKRRRGQGLVRGEAEYCNCAESFCLEEGEEYRTGE